MKTSSMVNPQWIWISREINYTELSSISHRIIRQWNLQWLEETDGKVMRNLSKRKLFCFHELVRICEKFYLSIFERRKQNSFKIKSFFGNKTKHVFLNIVRKQNEENFVENCLVRRFRGKVP